MEFLEHQPQTEFSQEVEADYLVTKAELGVWESREEIRLAQKANNKWLQEGDHNSKFFHAIVNQRRKTSTISSMQLVDGKVLNSLEVVHQGATRYFQDFLSASFDVEHSDLSFLLERVVTDDDNALLFHEPIVDKVKEIVFSILKHSAPGLSGLSFICLGRIWSKTMLWRLLGIFLMGLLYQNFILLPSLCLF